MIAGGGPQSRFQLRESVRISMGRIFDPTELQALSSRLEAALHLSVVPVSIAFSDSPLDGVKPFDEPMAVVGADGRTGRVPAGCVFWVKGVEASFSTVPTDHGNCSVGSFTHGFTSLSDVSSNSDVAELLGSGWVDAQAVASIPSIGRRYKYVHYGPLSEGTFSPDVVLLRVNGRQMMVVSDATGMSIEGKPQCHIIAISKDQNRVAASVGCALSRARTGMQPHEMTCAIPAEQLVEVVDSIERAADIDAGVAKYAAADARRFTTLNPPHG